MNYCKGERIVGIATNNKEEKQLYEAYGMTVFGVENRYDWTIYPNRPSENVYTNLRIEKNGTDVVNIPVCNRCIFEDNFLRTIDNFLYWINKDKPKEFEIENAVFRVLCETNSMFNHSIGNRKRKEQQEKEYKARRDAIIAEEERKLGLVRKYCKENDLVFKQKYEKMYLIKILDENVREMIVNADKDKLEWLVDFMHDHKDNTQAVIVLEGELDELVEKVK